VIERTLTELTRLGLLDDRDFVECWIASRTGRGPALLKQELRQKGIERSLAEEIIRTGISAEDECDAAWQVATRALLHQTLPLERAAFLRIRRLLQRRGFSFDVISRVCARLSEHQHADGDWLE
jgi:SOS response regulatory protein OraA/RecX